MSRAWGCRENDVGLFVVISSIVVIIVAGIARHGSPVEIIQYPPVDGSWDELGENEAVPSYRIRYYLYNLYLSSYIGVQHLGVQPRYVSGRTSARSAVAKHGSSTVVCGLQRI